MVFRASRFPRTLHGSLRAKGVNSITTNGVARRRLSRNRGWRRSFAPHPRADAGDQVGGLPHHWRVQPDFLRQIAEETKRKGVDRDAGQRADVGLLALQQRVAPGRLPGWLGLADQPDQAVRPRPRATVQRNAARAG
jgi:hypothetical protein